jgi:hypothetical protein
MPKRNYTLIAEHFGDDSDSIRESSPIEGGDRACGDIQCVTGR